MILAGSWCALPASGRLGWGVADCGSGGAASAPLTWFDRPVRREVDVIQVEKLRDNVCLGARFPAGSTSDRPGIAFRTGRAPANGVGGGVLVESVVSPHYAFMSSTRKMPVRIDEKKHTTFAGEHLIPSLADLEDAGFVSAKTGKTYSRGAVVYLGRDVTPEMMLERYCQVAPPPSDREVALRRLSAYCDALQATKIGNLVSLSFSAESLPILKVEQEYFLRETESRLP